MKVLGRPPGSALPALIGLVLVGAGCSASSPTVVDTRLPTPKSYAGTCRLVGSWCEPVAGRIPRALRRPLHLPRLGPNGTCPTSSGYGIDNNQFGGVALGSGPVRPLIAMSGDLAHGIVAFAHGPGTTWWNAKTIWFSYPRYRGPVFIRGRRLDGPGKTVFGEEPALIDPELPPGSTVNGTNGWREWPGYTFVHSLGCYAWQIDGTAFSYAVVFRAVGGKR